MDATFDLYTKKLKPHYSLLRGRVIKRSSPPELPTIKASSQLKLTTGGSAYDGSDDPIEIYYGKDCNANNCVYSKVKIFLTDFVFFAVKKSETKFILR